MVESAPAELPVSRRCELVGVSRSGLYKARRAATRPDGDAELRAQVEPIVGQWPGYGYRRVTRELARHGVVANHKRVLRVMRAEGWLCRLRCRSVRTTQSDHGLGVCPNRIQDLVVTQLDQLWVADLTYIRLPEGFVYRATVLDAYSRRVLGWKLARYLDARLATAALDQALARRPGARAIHHSDQGVQYASSEYVARLDGAGLVQSMSRRGCPRDNAQAESFFATLKLEEVRLNDYRNFAEAEARLATFIEDVCNGKRMHSALGYRSPVAFEAAERRSKDERSDAASNLPVRKVLALPPANGGYTPASRGPTQTPVPPSIPPTPCLLTGVQSTLLRHQPAPYLPQSHTNSELSHAYGLAGVVLAAGFTRRAPRALARMWAPMQPAS